MQWGSWLLRSLETTAVATQRAFHSASAAAKNLGCKLLFSHPPSATMQSWLLRSGCHGVDLQDPELHFNTLTLLQCLCTGFQYSHHSQPPFHLGENECWGAPGSSSRPRLRCGRARLIPLVLPQTPQNRCLIKTILSVAHAHALYT